MQRTATTDTTIAGQSRVLLPEFLHANSPLPNAMARPIQQDRHEGGVGPDGPASMNTNAHSAWLQGEAAVDRKNWKQAERSYRQALQIDPRHVPSLIGLSTALSQREAHREAHAAIISAYDLKPDHPSLIYAIAQRLRFFHEFERLERSLAHPRFAAEAPVPILAKAVVMLSSIGAQEAAVAMAEQAIRRDPGYAAAHYVRGNLHLFSGDGDAAEASYERSLRADPLLFQNSWMLASVRTQTPDRNHVPRLREQLTRARPGGEGEAYLSFGLYKELHDLGQYDEAWQALERGCRAKRKNVQYSLQDDIASVDAMIDTCSPGFVAQTSDVAQPSIPIFIVGMHRSGTTLLERMLAGHSSVGDAGETSAFDAQMQYATDHVLPGRYDVELVRRAANADYDLIASRYADSARWLSKGKPYFTEKLPMNFWNIGFIAKALPQARILFLARDPMDTCFSNLRTLFAGVATYSYVQSELAGFYLQYRRLMDYWRSILPDRLMEVRYDDLVEDPEAMAAKVAAFCGLDYQSSLVDVGRTSGRVATASAALARQGIRRDRGRLWRHYEHHLQPLLEGLQPVMVC